MFSTKILMSNSSNDQNRAYRYYRLSITDSDYATNDYKASLITLRMYDILGSDYIQFGSTLSAPELSSFPVENVKYDNSDSWVSAQNAPFPIDVEIDLGSAVLVKSFMLKSSAGANLLRAPNAFTLYGSADGSAYTEIYSTSGLNWVLFEEKTFEIF